MQCMGDLSERFYLEKGFNYLNFHKFLLNANGESLADDEDKVELASLTVAEQTNQELRDYISKSFPDRLRQYDLESKIAEKMSIETPLLKSQVGMDLVAKTPEVTAPCQSPMTQLNLLIENSQTSSKVIAERAKNEAQVLQKITQLRKEGLWSIKRLPKLVEPQRIKTHWDFLLDEMVCF